MGFGLGRPVVADRLGREKIRMPARMSASTSVQPMSATIAATSSTEPWSAVTRFSENMPRNGSTNGWVTLKIELHDVVAGVGDEQQQDDPQDQQRPAGSRTEGHDPRGERRAAGSGGDIGGVGRPDAGARPGVPGRRTGRTGAGRLSGGGSLVVGHGHALRRGCLDPKAGPTGITGGCDGVRPRRCNRVSRHAALRERARASACAGSRDRSCWCPDPASARSRSWPACRTGRPRGRTCAGRRRASSSSRRSCSTRPAPGSAR